LEFELTNGKWVAVESHEEVNGVEKKTISKVKRNWIIGIFAFVIFLSGSVVGKAATDWLTQLKTDNVVAIDAAGKTKADALTQDIQTSISGSVKTKISPMVEQKKTEIQSQLQAYFDSKASTMVTNSPQYQAAVADLERIEPLLLDNYKSQIDAAFNNVTTP
jgi:hypothetical protein